jgi:anti-sigma B factor antagonist
VVDDGVGELVEISVGPTAEGEPCLTVRGEIDLSNADEIQRAATATEGDRIVLDLAGVTFMDSSGLSMLLRLRDIRPVHLVAISDAVAHILDVTGMLKLFDLSAP